MTKQNNPTNGKITVSYNLLLFSFLILIILLILLFIIDYTISINLNFNDYLSFFSTGSVAIGLIYTARSLSFQYEVNKLKLEKEDEVYTLEKIRFTYEITSDWFKADISKNAEIVKRFIEPYKGQLAMPAKFDEFNNFLNSELGFEIRKAIGSNLNYFENISLLLADNIIDEESLKKCFKTVFLAYYDNLKEYIEYRQRGNGGVNVNAYVHFVNLCKRWHIS